jgi:hypothetical protein
MKNVHLIPTDKPSRLFDFMTQLLLLNNALPDEGTNMNRHIYITSNETIKEGDWVLNTNTNSIAKYTGHGGMDWWVKIILTTDQELIADVVQAIDDEFLEWFVKNSSCKSVKLNSISKCVTCNSSVKSSCDYVYRCNPQIFYKIIISQEEHNPFELPKALPDDVFYKSLESKQDNCCTPIGQIKRYVDCVGCDEKPSKKDTLKEGVQKLFENAAIKYADTQSDISMRKSHLEYSKSGQELWEETKTDFIEGASWQAEITVG